MARIGMRHVVAAPLTAHTNGSEPTYGTGFDVGKAISANVTINRNNNPLYADDAIAEDDNSVTGIEVEVNVDDLDDDTEADMGLVKKVTTGEGSSAVSTYCDTDEPAKDLGFGYMIVRRRNGVTTYQGRWYYKIKFSKESENAQTKGESIEWQTPTIRGRAVGLNVGGTGELRYRVSQRFETETAAATWLDGKAGITRS